MRRKSSKPNRLRELWRSLVYVSHFMFTLEHMWWDECFTINTSFCLFRVEGWTQIIQLYTRQLQWNVNLHQTTFQLMVSKKYFRNKK